MKLYHFTSHYGLSKIKETGFISIGDVPISPAQGLNAPWFSKSPLPKGNGLEGSAVNKSAIRITVEVPETPDLFTWDQVKTLFEIDEAWAAVLEDGQNSNDWRLNKSPVSIDHIIKTEIIGHPSDLEKSELLPRL